MVKYGATTQNLTFRLGTVMCTFNIIIWETEAETSLEPIMARPAWAARPSLSFKTTEGSWEDGIVGEVPLVQREDLSSVPSTYVKRWTRQCTPAILVPKSRLPEACWSTSLDDW